MKNEEFDRNDLTGKIVKKAGIERPSYSFTSKIMAQINSKQYSKVFIYQPIIKNETWIFLGLTLIAILLIIVLFPSSYPASIDLTKYTFSVHKIWDNSTLGFIEKVSLLKSLSWLAIVLFSGWLLLFADRILRSIKSVE